MARNLIKAASVTVNHNEDRSETNLATTIIRAS